MQESVVVDVIDRSVNKPSNGWEVVKGRAGHKLCGTRQFLNVGETGPKTKLLYAGSQRDQECV